MHSGHLGKSWDQQGVMNIESINGVYKVKITSYGKYRITLCRYPLESGYKINQHVPAMKKSTEVVSPLTESVITSYSIHYTKLYDSFAVLNFNPAMCWFINRKLEMFFRFMGMDFELR